MAAKINMLKLLQEVRGFAQFTSRPEESRPPGPLLLQFRGAARRRRQQKVKRFLKIDMQEPPNIPQSVPITHLKGHE